MSKKKKQSRRFGDYQPVHNKVMNFAVEQAYRELRELEAQGFAEGDEEWDNKWEELDFFIWNSHVDGVPTRIRTRDGGYAKEVIVLFELDEA